MLFYTSATTCYLPKARALGYSLKKYNPDAKFYLVLSDGLPDEIDLSKEPFDGILYSDDIELDINMSKAFWFYLHDITELCTAVKGWTALELLARTGEEKIVYLDPDMVVFKSLKNLELLLDEHDIIITPHRLMPEEKFDKCFYGDHQLYTRGIFNLGFLAVKNNKNGVSFLKWWKKMLESHCYIDDPNGLFTDQKIIDLAPAFFETLFICRDESYNISWWNITQRKIDGNVDDLRVNGKPVHIYHFSNFDSGLHEEIIKTYCGDNSSLWQLFKWYEQQQQKYGYKDYQSVKCKYDYYDNGQKILSLARKMTRKRSDIMKVYNYSDPFKTKDPKGLYQYYSSFFPEYLNMGINQNGSLEKDYRMLYEKVINSVEYKLANKFMEKFNRFFPYNSVARKNIKKFYLFIKNIKKKSREEKIKKIYVIENRRPIMASVVIVNPSNFNSMYDCLESLIKNNQDLKGIEIIVAKGLDEEIEKELRRHFINLRISKNNNIEKLIEEAEAPYVLLFNENMRSSENALLVGLNKLQNKSYGLLEGKTILSDDVLLEAGSIVLQSGERYSYGFKGNPELGKFNYTKKIDSAHPYGCWINKEAFDEVGGLDEDFNFVYKFTDLAMKLRNGGYDVIYYPKSVFFDIRESSAVVSGNSASDVEKFKLKWKEQLIKENAYSKNDEFWARDRSKDKDTILFIDDRVPNFDKSAGDRTSYQYIEILSEMGFNVKDIGDDFMHKEPYASNLESMGVEIIGADGTGDAAWEELLRECGRFFNFVYLARPNIAEKYLKKIREYTDAKIYYYCCDLHFIRLEREYRIKNDLNKLKEIAEVKRKELDICSQADVVLTLSTYEQKILKKELNSSNILLNPIFVYKSFPNVNKNFAVREGLLFVGGFAHTPNVDAVLWFCKNIFPKISSEIKGIKFHIVGSNPTDEITNLQSDNIIVHGFLDDVELSKLYSQCRITVVPLRYGAGVKGKVLEAMYYGVPIISTSIGLEGIPEIEKYIAKADEPEAFCEEVCRLYQDVHRLTRESENNQQYTKHYFSQSTVRVFFEKLFSK